MNKKQLPYGLQPYEIGFLILLGVALYYCSPDFWHKPWPIYVYTAAVLAAIPVLILRCREEWRLMPNRWLFFSLASAWTGLFVVLGNPTFNYADMSSLPAWMFNIYTSPNLDEGHGVLIPFVVLALFWWKRKELVNQPLGLWWPAVGMVVMALVLHFIGFKAQQQRLSVIGFFLGLYGLMGLAWGKGWLKRSFFPFFLFAFCIPVGEYAVPLTMPLRLLVSRIVEVIAHLGLAPDLIRDGTQLFDAQHTFAYEVAAACSGIRSLVALGALMTIYGFINFQAPWKRLVMMLIAVPLAILGNVVRLSFTIGVAETFGQSAGKAVETKFGFVTFAVAVGCAFLVARWLERIGQDKPAAEPEPATAEAFRVARPLPVAPLVVVLVLIGITAAGLTHARTNQRLGLPGVKTRPLAGSQNLEVLLPETVPGYQSQWLQQASVVTNMLPADTSYGQRIYTDADGFQMLVNVVLMGSSRSSIHDPQVCLTAQGWNINNAISHVVTVPVDRPMHYDLPVMRILSTRQGEYNGQTLTQSGVYAYWFVDADRYTAVHSHRMLWMAHDVIFKNVLDRWAYISIFAVCPPGQEDAAFERIKKLIAASVPDFQLVPQAETAAK